MARGGKRPGAGAPKGNMNALKHGRRSRQFAELGILIAASPAARETLIQLAEREAAHNRTADAIAAYIIGQVVTRGLVRGKDRLSVLPDVLDGRSINELSSLHTRKTQNLLPTIKPHARKPTSNPTLDSNESAQNA